MNTPLVSICCATFNHAAYLRQTLDSFLSQKCDFGFEILIHDDCSTDGTVDILREYEAKHPGIVKPLYEEENQYSKGISIDQTFNFPRARGKYIALCEGDDYWCDETKLQRQVDHMESDPGCTFCFTNGWIHDESGAQSPRTFVPYYESERAHFKGGSAEYSLGEIARLSFIPTASFLFRADVLSSMPEGYFRKGQHGDLRMKLYFTAAGHAWYEDMHSCVYRENVAGSAMQLWRREKRTQLFSRCETVVDMAEDVDRFSNGSGHDGLWAVRDHYLWVMAHNAPDLKSLLTGRVGERWRKLALMEKVRCAIRAVIG